MGNIANLCWDGLTLKYVFDKKIVIPYLLFVITAFLFELFLTILFSISSFIFFYYGFTPNFVYYVCGVILAFLLIFTVSILLKTIRRLKNLVNKCPLEPHPPS
ncbi:hypothetical protein [Bacillus xiapuensis]|uniref:Uncharacterized protein n=1 Tax=Bacillus xiapuensis TaxID=2014075 RepID=A0ABU6NAP3_9BACI|nr:hypothetical protein [Bacillus xiapuensis]